MRWMLPSGGQGPLGIRNIGHLGPWVSPGAQQASSRVGVRGSVCVHTRVCAIVYVHELVCLREKAYVCICLMWGLMLLNELIAINTTVC